jgi:hypothetical protein
LPLLTDKNAVWRPLQGEIAALRLGAVVKTAIVRGLRAETGVKI